MTLLFSSALPVGERGQAARLVWNLPRPIKCGPLGLVNPQTWVETDVMVRPKNLNRAAITEGEDPQNGNYPTIKVIAQPPHSVHLYLVAGVDRWPGDEGYAVAGQVTLLHSVSGLAESKRERHENSGPPRTCRSQRSQVTTLAGHELNPSILHGSVA